MGNSNDRKQETRDLCGSFEFFDKPRRQLLEITGCSNCSVARVSSERYLIDGISLLSSCCHGFLALNNRSS